jgi:tRNA G18 (ribose-2'-O)-methylase SpoU
MCDVLRVLSFLPSPPPSYTLVGLEQTAGSVPLPSYAWPRRVVLVLGREKEGVPPEVTGRVASLGRGVAVL